MKQQTRLTKQRGVMLLEALIAILIFSLGILALVGMMATAVKNTGDAKYRADATFHANKVIAQMWVDNLATLEANYATGGPKFKTWLADLSNSATGLPDANATVNFAAVGAASKRVTVTITWKAPQDSVRHQYVALAQLQPAQNP